MAGWERGIPPAHPEHFITDLMLGTDYVWPSGGSRYGPEEGLSSPGWSRVSEFEAGCL